jgi:hypothetical protein
MTLSLAGMTYRDDFLAEPFGPGSRIADESERSSPGSA